MILGKWITCSKFLRLENCNKSSRNDASSKNGLFYYTDRLITLLFVQFVFTILSAIVSFTGLVGSIFIVLVIRFKSNESELKENQYNFLVLNAALNSAILFINLLSMINMCQSDFGLFCSSIHSWYFSQFFKMIVGEYASNCLRLLSNFAYVGFALNRLSLIGKDHKKIVTYVSKLTVKQFLGRTVGLCLVLSVVKVFRFMPNMAQPEEEYPFPIAHYFDKLSFSLAYIYMSFDIVFNVINYVLFVVVCFVVDVALAVKLKQTIDEKEKNKAKLGQSQSANNKYNFYSSL